MRKSLLIIILALILVPIGMYLAGMGEAANPYRVEWNGQSGAKLLRHANALYDAEKYDSALVLYSYLSNRLDEPRLAPEECRAALDATGKAAKIYRQRYGDMSKAYTFANRMLDAAKQHGDKKMEVVARLHVAQLYTVNDRINSHVVNRDTIYSLIRQAISQAIDLKYWDMVYQGTDMLVIYAFTSGEADSVAKDIGSYCSLPTSDPVIKQHQWVCRGMQALDSGDYESALARFKEAYEARVTDDPQRIGMYFSNCAEAYYRKGDYHKALAYMDSIENQKGCAPEIKMQVARERMVYYTAMGDSANTRRCRLEYLTLKDELRTQAASDKISEMQLLSDLDVTNASLREESERSRAKTRIIILCCVFAGVVCLVLAFLWHAYRKLNESHKQLYSTNLQLLAADDEARRQAPAGLQPTSQTKYSTSTLTDDDKERIFDKARRAMLDANLICNPDFSLQMLADVTQERSRDISQVINERTGENFHAFVNEYRVREACRRINDTDKYGHLSLTGIADSVGVKSRASFVAMFKKFVGMTPSEYAKMAKQSK